MGVRFVYQEDGYRPNGRTNSCYPNHKSFNYQEKDYSKVMKERGNLHYKTDKGGINTYMYT